MPATTTPWTFIGGPLDGSESIPAVDLAAPPRRVYCTFGVAGGDSFNWARGLMSQPEKGTDNHVYLYIGCRQYVYDGVEQH